MARPFQVTDELFDLSTMAMEYFKDKLEPILPEIVRKDDFFESRGEHLGFWLKFLSLLNFGFPFQKPIKKYSFLICNRLK